MKEKPIETQILYFLRSLGGYFVKVHSGAMFASYTRKSGIAKRYKVKLADEGTNDLIGAIKGVPITIEVKKDLKEIQKWERQKETDRRSAAQHYHQDQAHEAGFVTLVACSVEMVEEDLKKLKII